jgi:hypothetical protein
MAAVDMTGKINPLSFAIAVLKMQLYAWQARLMISVWHGQPTTARTPNGAGKTSVCIVVLALCMLSEFPGATIVLTSATFRQVRDQVFAALKQHSALFPGWKWHETSIETPQGGRIVGFSTDSGGKFEGFHAYPDRPLLIIVDEAKTLDDDIFIAIDRCQPTHLLYISSPGGLLGRFHDSFKSPRFASFAIGIADCPHITPEFIAAMKEQYGEDSDIYRSMIEGNFGDGNTDGRVVSFVNYENAIARPPLVRSGTRQAFFDFAKGGGDENVIATRDGNKATLRDHWANDPSSERNTMRFFKHSQELMRDGYKIYGDEDGVGHGYIVALRQMGVEITAVANNSPARDPHYFNLAAEQWWTLNDKLKRSEVIIPADELLKKQLLNKEETFVERDGVKIYGRTDGKLQLMPKSKTNTKSPDRADAIVGVMYDYPEYKPVKAMGWLDPNMGRLEQAAMEEGRGQIAGAFCD